MHKTKYFLFLLFVFFFSVNVQASSVRLETLAQFNKYPEMEYSALWGYTAPDGREYAILGVQHGTSIIDITDAPTLREVAFIPGYKTPWRELKAFNGYAYVVFDTERNDPPGNVGGMQIIDLTQLPNSARLVSTYTGFKTAHTIYIDEARKLIFTEGNNSAVIRILDISNPTQPQQISSFGVECHDMYVKNNIAYVAEGYHSSWSMYDTTNPRAPTLITRVEIPNGGYVHNTAVTEDNRYVMTTEEIPEGKTVKVWDISNLSNIRIVSEYLGPNNLAHNVHIKGRYAYIAHYGAGIRILDMMNPFMPVEVAHHQFRETMPPSYEGAWEIYPYFKSGKLIFSDISAGLFVVPFAGAKE
ncbi:MAG: choice-of-anchor B family protein [Bdellovibrionales bacterium]